VRSLGRPAACRDLCDCRRAARDLRRDRHCRDRDIYQARPLPECARRGGARTRSPGSARESPALSQHFRPRRCDGATRLRQPLSQLRHSRAVAHCDAARRCRRKSRCRAVVTPAEPGILPSAGAATAVVAMATIGAEAEIPAELADAGDGPGPAVAPVATTFPRPSTARPGGAVATLTQLWHSRP